MTVMVHTHIKMPWLSGICLDKRNNAVLREELSQFYYKDLHTVLW